MPKKKRASTPSPKPVKRRRGRPEGTGFHPTPEQRELVRMACALGIPEERIARGIISPTSGEGISPTTLRKHFRTELDQSLLASDVQAGMNLLKLTQTSAAAAIFWTKSRLRWRERDTPSTLVNVQQQAVAAAEVMTELPAEQRSILDIGRRIAYTLHLARRAKEGNAG